MESIQSRPQPVHPITGAPIRILRTGANIWKEGKILEWVRNGLPPFSSSSSPHDKIATNYIPKDDETQQIKYYVITEHIPNLKEFLTRNTKQPQKQSQQQQQYIVFIAKSIIESFGGEEFIKSNQIPNVLALDEIHLMYPSVGEQWNGTLAHAVYQIALVLRYTRLLGFDSTEHIENTNITYISPNDIPKIWLLQQYYEAKEPKRAREIRYCLQKNIANPHIDKIIFLNESRCIPKQCQSDKITEEIIGNRLTYADILRYIKTSVPPNVIVLFSNSDIYFDSSLTRVWSLLLENKFLALLRYDEEIDAPPKLFGPRSDSQDAWIVASDDIHSREWSGYEDFNFIFGKMGCDNTMAYQMMRKKFLVVNPALSIQAVHVHKSNIRTYETKDMVESPCYVYIDPTPIQEFHAETDLSKYKYSNILYKGEQEINMPLYKFSNSTLTNLGLVYGYNKLYMGSSEESKQHWSKSKIGSLTPSAKCAKSIAVPIKNDIHKRPEEYILFYLSKVLAIREKIGNGAAFWGPEVLDWLRLFSWSEEKLAVVSCDSVKQIYSDEVYAYITTPTYLSPTDIDCSVKISSILLMEPVQTKIRRQLLLLIRDLMRM